MAPRHYAPMIASAVSVAPLTIDELIDEGGPLFKMHFDEIRAEQGHRDIDPAWDQYRAMEERGLIVCFGLRDTLDDSRPLVGYMLTIFVARHLHYDSSFGQVDVAFVHPDFRKSSGSRMMAAETREALRLKGATEILWHAVPGSRMHAIADKSDKFVLVDQTFLERI